MHRLGANTAKKPDAGAVAKGDILTMTPLEVNSRYIWSRSNEVESFAKTLGKVNGKVTIHGNDIPMLEKLLREVPDAALNPNVDIILPAGTLTDPTSKGLKEFIYNQKQQLSNKLVIRNKKLVEDFGETHMLTQDQIAGMTNIRSRFLDGHHKENPAGGWADEDMLAMDTYRKQFADRIGRQVDEVPDIWQVPQHVRAIYKTSPTKGQPRTSGIEGTELDNFITENMVTIKTHQRVYQDDLTRASEMVLGERLIRTVMPNITTTSAMVQ